MSDSFVETTIPFCYLFRTATALLWNENLRRDVRYRQANRNHLTEIAEIMSSLLQTPSNAEPIPQEGVVTGTDVEMPLLQMSPNAGLPQEGPIPGSDVGGSAGQVPSATTQFPDHPRVNKPSGASSSDPSASFSFKDTNTTVGYASLGRLHI
jgi:hypothetical protein